MASPEIIEATDANFESEVLQSDTPVVVDFWAPWCGPCKQIAPILDQLAGEFKGRVRVAKVDVDRNRMVANAYAIQSIPTLSSSRPRRAEPRGDAAHDGPHADMARAARCRSCAPISCVQNT